MRAIIADLLDFTRTHQGSRLPIAPQPCNLGIVVEHTVEELQASKCATIAVELTGNLAGQWDCARIGQLVSNIVTNAVTHGSPEQPVYVSAKGDPATVVLRVRNAGEVIPHRDQRNVFKPLNRGPRRADRDSEGLGLGLYICKQIVEAHHGSIQFESTLERGIEVTVELPRGMTPTALAGE
jgi:signal transduction histidine kinase